MKTILTKNEKQPRIGDVVLIKGNLPRDSCKIRRICDHVENSRNTSAAKVMLLSKHLLQLLLNLLYPLECGDNTSSIVD